MTKAWLSKRGVSYVEHNVSTDMTALQDLTGMGYRSTPVTTIGKATIVAYSVPRLEASLEAHNL